VYHEHCAVSTAKTSYDLADRVLYFLFDRGMAPEQVVGLGYPHAAVDRVAGMMAASEFKRQMPPVAELELSEKQAARSEK
jgi:NH3-dependent NAD+ synthetase